MSCNSPFPTLTKKKKKILRKTFGYTVTVGYGGGGGVVVWQGWFEKKNATNEKVGLKKKTPQMKICPKTVHDFSPHF